MIRWSCPNGCPAVLGPARAHRKATCRVCLTCSAGQPLLVAREPTVLVKTREKKVTARKAAREAARAKRDAERLAARAEKALAEAEQQAARDQYEARMKRARAVDYNVSSNGRHYGTFDALPPALRMYRAIARSGVGVTLTRVKNGAMDTGCFHGRVFVGWETETGERISRHE